MFPYVETEDELDDLDKELAGSVSLVQNGIQTSSSDLDATEYIIPEQDLKESQGIMNNEQAMMSSIQVKTMSDSILKTFDNRIATVVHPAQPKNLAKNQELPYYEENSSEWLVFEVDHEDTSKTYRLRQNKARVRKAIEEVARNTSKSHPYYEATQDQLRCVRSLRTVRFKKRPPRPQSVAQIAKYLKLRCYDYAAAKAEKKAELLDLEATYTATEEDEGGGIQRLKLQAALLGSRRAESVIKELDLIIKKKTYWTDLNIVLSWIKSDPRHFKTFVAHRLAEMKDVTQPQEWRWISTANNPADDSTRDIPENFTKNHRWFTGPHFLKQEDKFWPEKRIFKKKITGEEKVSNITASVNDCSSYASPDPERFSIWTLLWRTIAIVLQFIRLCKPKEHINISNRLEKQDPTWRRTKSSEIRKTQNKHLGKRKTPDRTYIPIEPKLLDKAKILILKRSQAESFKQDIKDIEDSRNLPNSSKLKKLDVEVNNGLLRLRGRINAIQGVTEDYKRPIVLDSKNKITKFIIEYYNKLFNHGNHATVMNERRQHFLILGLRSAVRSALNHCQWCKTYRSKPQELLMGDLPPERRCHGAPPFTCTAVDYYGPMVITVGRRHEKRWGALYTCLTTRAVHIELTPSLTTNAMIMALRRFAARRGMPKIIYSDNGTNFVRANKDLKQAFEEMKKENLVTEAEELGVQWKFMPPGAPNMGGTWENTNSAARIGIITDKELVGCETWKTAQQLTEHFWKRWLREYLPNLLPRKIDGRPELSNLKVGDIVLIVDSTPLHMVKRKNTGGPSRP